MLDFITRRTLGFVVVAKINMTPFICGFLVFSSYSLKSPACFINGQCRSDFDCQLYLIAEKMILI